MTHPLDAYFPGQPIGRLSHMDEDPDPPDDGLILVAGVLYDAETGEEAGATLTLPDCVVPGDAVRFTIDTDPDTRGAYVGIVAEEDGQRVQVNIDPDAVDELIDWLRQQRDEKEA